MSTTITVKETKEVTIDQTHLDNVDTLKNVSSKIRYLDAVGYSRGAIAKILDKRPQHVRNVLTMPVNKVAEDFALLIKQ